MNVDYSATGVVFNIQRFSIHDGPGIRTIVFLKGCPLFCKWCCNPESQKLKPVVMFEAEKCIHCGKCMTVCKAGALSPHNPGFINRNKCIGCGECVSICPTNALSLKGRKMDVQQVIKELKKDATNYRRSGGGITLSGGEPMVQHAFATELLKACKSQGWHTAIETTGFTTDKSVIETIYPYVDLVLLDMKAMNDEVHKRYTGVSNKIILENAKRISEITNTVVRVPTIPGVNANEENFHKLCNYVKTLNAVDTIHILPYHTYGENKYGLLGEDYEMKDTRSLTPDEINTFQSIVENNGFNCVIGG